MRCRYACSSSTQKCAPWGVVGSRAAVGTDCSSGFSCGTDKTCSACGAVGQACCGTICASARSARRPANCSPAEAWGSCAAPAGPAPAQAMSAPAERAPPAVVQTSRAAPATAVRRRGTSARAGPARRAGAAASRAAAPRAQPAPTCVRTEPAAFAAAWARPAAPVRTARRAYPVLNDDVEVRSCGTAGNPCCGTTCNTGAICGTDGTCAACGSLKQPCCGNVCSGGTVSPRTLARPAAGPPPCCAGSACSASGYSVRVEPASHAGPRQSLAAGRVAARARSSARPPVSARPVVARGMSAAPAAPAPEPASCMNGTCGKCGGNGQACCPNGNSSPTCASGYICDRNLDVRRVRHRWRALLRGIFAVRRRNDLHEWKLRSVWGANRMLQRRL